MPRLQHGKDYHPQCAFLQRTRLPETSAKTTLRPLSFCFLPVLPLQLSSRHRLVNFGHVRFVSSRRSAAAPGICNINMAAARRKSQPDDSSQPIVNGDSELSNSSSDFLPEDDPAIFQKLEDEDLSDDDDELKFLNDDEKFEFDEDFGFENAPIADESDDEDDIEDEDEIEGSAAVDVDDEDDLDEIEKENDDFDEDVEHITPLQPKQDFRPSSGRAGLADEPDENDDDIEDVDELLNPISERMDEDSIDDVNDEALDDRSTVFAGTEKDNSVEIDPEEFEAESEEDIQSAADILQERGLLGLGVEVEAADDTDQPLGFGGIPVVQGSNDDVDIDLLDDDDDDDDDDDEQQTFDLPQPKPAKKSSRTSTASARKRTASSLLEDAKDELDLGITDDIELEDAEDVLGDGVDGDEEDGDLNYLDIDGKDEDGIGLTSQSKFGRVWELNEDTYVTITEAGESYGYELDMDDQEDQDMATVRRGKQGGWSGGFASYPASELPEGSREWIARRSYELMTKASYKNMLHWSKWHQDPPPEITALYPEEPVPKSSVGICILDTSGPPDLGTEIGDDEDPNDPGLGEDEDEDDLVDFQNESLEAQPGRKRRAKAETDRILWLDENIEGDIINAHDADEPPFPSPGEE